MPSGFNSRLSPSILTDSLWVFFLCLYQGNQIRIPKTKSLARCAKVNSLVPATPSEAFFCEEGMKLDVGKVNEHIGADGAGIPLTHLGWAVVADIAIQEISRAGISFPASKLPMSLKPTSLILGRSLWLYRAHARELCQRYTSGEDLKPGTHAECCASLSNTSITAPPSAELRAAQAEATIRTAKLGDFEIPKDIMIGLRHSAKHDQPSEGRTEEILSDLRLKLSCEMRGL